MSTTTTKTNRQFRLKTRPEGRVTEDTFELVEQPVPEPGPDEVLVRNVYLSLDPTNRIWISDVEQYMPPVQIGEVMRGLGIGKVESSGNPNFKAGDYASGLLGWQDYALVKPGDAFPLVKLPPLPIPLSAMAGAAGMTGWTAYFGLFDVGRPQKGETLVVSAAAGAVGSVVGQLGKISGLHVVGITGSDAKGEWLQKELGFDAFVNRNSPTWKKDLELATPNGVDINFENVGGEIMEAVYRRMNLNGRIVLCGLISSYNESSDEKTRLSLAPALMKRLRIEGFIVSDYGSRLQEATEKLVHWIAEGKLKYKETIINGLEKAPEALNMLFDGANTGKLLVSVSSQ